MFAFLGRTRSVLALLSAWGPRHNLLGVLGVIVIAVLAAMLASSRTQGHSQ